MALSAGNALPDLGHSVASPVRCGPSPDPRAGSQPDALPDHAAGASRGRHGTIIATDIPARLDALPFGRFHVLVIAALGITWILDGLEVTLAGSLSGELRQSSALGLSDTQIGLAGSGYLAGAVLGAFFFGWLTDRLGRKKLFTVTLVVYLVGT